MVIAHINVPYTGIVVDCGVDLTNLFSAAPVPYIEAVIIVDTRQLME